MVDGVEEAPVRRVRAAHGTVHTVVLVPGGTRGPAGSGRRSGPGPGDGRRVGVSPQRRAAVPAPSPNNVLFRENKEPARLWHNPEAGLHQGPTTRDRVPTTRNPPQSGTHNELTDPHALGAVRHFALTAKHPHPGRRRRSQPANRDREPGRTGTSGKTVRTSPVGLSTLVARLPATTPAPAAPQDANQERPC